MLIPTKHENLEKNILVLGADILRYIKSNGSSPIEFIFQYLKERKDITIDHFFDVVTYLWIIGFINLEDDILSIIKE